MEQKKTTETTKETSTGPGGARPSSPLHPDGAPQRGDHTETKSTTKTETTSKDD
jgi:hypothetical protein